jgi:hypothetical protein
MFSSDSPVLRCLENCFVHRRVPQSVGLVIRWEVDSAVWRNVGDFGYDGCVATVEMIHGHEGGGRVGVTSQANRSRAPSRQVSISGGYSVPAIQPSVRKYMSVIGEG